MPLGLVLLVGSTTFLFGIPWAVATRHRWKAEISSGLSGDALQQYRIATAALYFQILAFVTLLLGGVALLVAQ